MCCRYHKTENPTVTRAEKGVIATGAKRGIATGTTMIAKPGLPAKRAKRGLPAKRAKRGGVQRELEAKIERRAPTESALIGLRGGQAVIREKTKRKHHL